MFLLFFSPCCAASKPVGEDTGQFLKTPEKLTDIIVMIDLIYAARRKATAWPTVRNRLN
jgi:hypothetical protein